MGPAFFGLTPEDKVIFLEPTFILMYYMGFTYNEAMSLPVWQRKWFLDRMIREIKESRGSRSAHDNDPGSRELMGMHRNQVPAKLRRFT